METEWYGCGAIKALVKATNMRTKTTVVKGIRPCCYRCRAQKPEPVCRHDFICLLLLLLLLLFSCFAFLCKCSLEYVLPNRSNCDRQKTILLEYLNFCLISTWPSKGFWSVRLLPSFKVIARFTTRCFFFKCQNLHKKITAKIFLRKTGHRFRELRFTNKSDKNL